MTMTDLGQTWERETVSTGASKEKYYPTIYLNKKQMKAAGLTSKEVGTELVMHAKVRIRSMSDSVNGEGSLDLEVIEASFGDADKDSTKILYGDD
jgi:hypothetical protein